MGKFNPRNFVNPDTLKCVSFENLLHLLRQPGIREYLEGKAEGTGKPRLDLAVSEDRFDYDRLSRVLLMPEDGYPDDLADALHHIAELANVEAVQMLQDEMGDELDLGKLGDEPSPADVALHAWLRDRPAVERVLGRQFLDNPKRFLAFLGPELRGPDLGEVDDVLLAPLVDHLKFWYRNKKGSDFVRVLPYERGGAWWFLVRHAMPVQRKGVIKDGKPTSTVERPEKHDIVVYTPERDELAIHAASKGEEELYREAFGRYLFPNGRKFTNVGKYSLKPLGERGATALSVAGIHGLDSVVLVQLQVVLGPSVVQTISAPDVFLFYATREKWKFPEDPSAATFEVRFSNVKRPRRLTIRKPNVAKYHREGDKDLIDIWMTQQGFIVEKAKK